MSHSALTLAVASGKGGTGKTMVATNLAAWAARLGHQVVLADCDVDAPNDHLFFDGYDKAVQWREVAKLQPEIDTTACTAGCTSCRDTCRFGAVRIFGDKPVLFPELCHSCGACVAACKAGAISEHPHHIGRVGVAPLDRHLSVVSGVMDIGETDGPMLVREVRAAASKQKADVVLLDAPPGVACQVVASVRGADLVLLVTEPTRFGLHDLKLMVQLGRELELRMAVVVNRDKRGVVDIEGTCAVEGVPVISHIPFERAVAETYAAGKLVVGVLPEAEDWFAKLWGMVEELTAANQEGRVA
ncbi:MAG: P-loop NTPase [Acidimicrobiales bacterium]